MQTSNGKETAVPICEIYTSTCEVRNSVHSYFWFVVASGRVHRPMKYSLMARSFSMSNSSSKKRCACPILVRIRDTYIQTIFSSTLLTDTYLNLGE